ncbi:DUF721 domain-containing protein [Thermosipho sp. 1063]|uniref:DUF721 domain-containing protein n=1 Tax=Thermosipho sp. 1063 TaxID=1462747 RepID=UPI0009518FA9|nr:DUF721 domain-containing protein [Thermosipho sp. 1063]
MKKLAEVFKELSKKSPLFRKLYISSISRDNFKEVIGVPFNEHCKVTYFNRGNLYIECDEMYAIELQFFREKIRENMNKKLGEDYVKKVIIKKRRN